VLHRHVVVMSIDTVPVPRLSDDERVTIDELGYKRDGIIHASVCYGYMERPNIPAALHLLDPAHTEGHIDADTASYFLSKLELIAGDEPTMAPWRKRLFIATSYITADAAAYFKLPLDRTVVIGSRIEV
jgi:KUP system potassium uptake protein